MSNVHRLLFELEREITQLERRAGGHAPSPLTDIHGPFAGEWSDDRTYEEHPASPRPSYDELVELLRQAEWYVGFFPTREDAIAECHNVSNRVKVTLKQIDEAQTKEKEDAPNRFRMGHNGDEKQQQSGTQGLEREGDVVGATDTGRAQQDDSAVHLHENGAGRSGAVVGESDRHVGERLGTRRGVGTAYGDIEIYGEESGGRLNAERMTSVEPHADQSADALVKPESAEANSAHTPGSSPPSPPDVDVAVCPTCRVRHPNGWACPKELESTRAELEAVRRESGSWATLINYKQRAEAAEAKVAELREQNANQLVSVVVARAERDDLKKQLDTITGAARWHCLGVSMSRSRGNKYEKAFWETLDEVVPGWAALTPTKKGE